MKNKILNSLVGIVKRSVSKEKNPHSSKEIRKRWNLPSGFDFSAVQEGTRKLAYECLDRGFRDRDVLIRYVEANAWRFDFSIDECREACIAVIDEVWNEYINQS